MSLARATLLNRARGCLILPLATYWDGSGDESRTSPESVFAIGGFLAQLEEWDAFCPDWKAALRGYGLTSYRSTTIENFKKTKPKEWPQWRVIELRLTLLRVLRDHCFKGRGFAVGLRRNVFDHVADQYALERKRVAGQYVLAGLGLLSLIYQSLGILGSVEAQQEIAVFLEAGDAGQDRLVKLLRRENRDGHIGSVVMTMPKQRSTATGEMEGYPPFEAADLFAYEVRYGHELVGQDAPEADYRPEGLAFNDILTPRVARADVDHLLKLCKSASIPRRT